ncbi:hypothetical protein JOB18_047433 [Solea senegalensis]|uniref:HMG box domain-containing protein n=1 Tax=Solea senegalensis TaxID=28829 RepID=A0AAV6SV43_SOLSE|nr:hypothetical protein JOB18_047433 [Solea senegalensis]
MVTAHTTERKKQIQPVLTLPQGLEQNLAPVGIVNGELVFALPAGTSFAPQSNSLSQKRTSESQDENQPYVTKPPNAFMLYLKEQRLHVVAELQCKNNAQVNTVLGQRWRSLSSQEQAIYYEEAEQLRKLHAQQHPEWSSVQNYGKKRKRIRRKYYTSAEGLSNSS